MTEEIISQSGKALEMANSHIKEAFDILENETLKLRRKWKLSML